jgi:alkylation response protein AidB-like acyl-CoA dehydrogenase
MFSLPTGTAGMQINQIDMMGGGVVNDVYLTDCFVSEDRLVGVEGQGWAQLVAGLNIERLIIGAMFLGYAQRAF